MRDLTMLAFDVNARGMLLIPFTWIIGVLILIFSPIVVSWFVNRAARKKQAQPDAKDQEQAAQSQTDDTK